MAQVKKKKVDWLIVIKAGWSGMVVVVVVVGAVVLCMYVTCWKCFFWDVVWTI